jgi:hypothetical protein
MTDRELLLALRAKLATPSRWTQMAGARDKRGGCVDVASNQAVCWCLAGACVNQGTFYEFRLLGFQNISQLVAWNDAPERTHADVLARIDEALERLS